MNFPSKVVENAVENLSRLPGIGKRTALRLVLHLLKQDKVAVEGFGEAYFSTVNKDDIKGWKKHTKMTLNLVVPVGEIEFVIYNDLTKEFFSVVLSQNNYQTCFIPWLSANTQAPYAIVCSDLLELQKDTQSSYTNG